MDIANRRTICPFALKKTIVAAIGEPKSITPNGRDKFLIETQNEEQSNMIAKIKQIDGTPCNVQIHYNMNHYLGIIYLYEYDIHNITRFEDGLRQKYPISEVKPPTWLKPRNPNASAFLITFQLQNTPEQLRIPGERITKVYRYYNKPILCTNCISYGHTYKRYNKETPICARCASIGHSKLNCQQRIKCFSCKKYHYTGDRRCNEHKFQQCIIKIQTDQKIDR